MTRGGPFRGAAFFWLGDGKRLGWPGGLCQLNTEPAVQFLTDLPDIISPKASTS